jgi:hypothetical protein
MPTAQSTIEVQCRMEVVFAFLDDFTQASRWVESCTSLEQTSPEPRAVGSSLLYQFRQGGRNGQMVGVITKYLPNQQLQMRFTDPKFIVEVSLQLTATPTGTKVQETIAILPQSFFGKLLSPLISLGNRSQVKKNLARLKSCLERSTTSGLAPS